MTIIAFDGTAMAADRAAWSGPHAWAVRKLFRIDEHKLTFTQLPVLVGFAGTAWYAMAVLEWIKTGVRPPEVPEADRNGDVALIADSRGRIWRLSAGHLVAQPVRARRATFGAGAAMGVAWGAMECGGSAKRAVGLACKFTDLAGLGVDVVSFGRKK